MTILDGFEFQTANVNSQSIAYATAGSGPPVLLLHGFPQTHAMWHGVAPALSKDFTVIAADLRGYGESSKPSAMQDMSFREMAADQTALMQHLGFDRFHLVGHDRGARTAHRMALDSPEVLISVTIMDIVPTRTLLVDLTHPVARAYYHWFFLAQPTPLPETMIAHDADPYFESCLSGWGPSGLDQFETTALDAYRAAWRDPATIHSMCNDYRAAIDIDINLDTADVSKKIDTPALLLYGADGVMAKTFNIPDTWNDILTNMKQRSVPGGHFFPDTHPKDTLRVLLPFLKEQRALVD